MIAFAHLFDLHVDLCDILDFGSGPAGHLRIVRITGGNFEGRRVSGDVLEGGGDWQTLRDDGVAELDVRCLLRAKSGALVHLYGTGMRHGPADVMARLGRGDEVPAEAYYFREFVRFTTSAPELQWLNKMLAVATASRQRNSAHLEVFEIL